MQGNITRKMPGYRQQVQGEIQDAPEYMISTNRIIRSLKQTHKIKDWDSVALQKHFAWAGFVSKIREQDLGRITYPVLRYKDRECLNRIEENHHGRQFHGRKLEVWRYGSIL